MSTIVDNRIFTFLIRLNIEYDKGRGRIISRQPLPSIAEVFAELRREESRRVVMLGKKNTTHAVETSALANGNVVGRSNKTNKRPQIWCHYCNKAKHTREMCQKLHGKPANWKGSHEGRFTKNPTAYEAPSANLSQEQLNHILTRLKPKPETSYIPNAPVA